MTESEGRKRYPCFFCGFEWSLKTAEIEEAKESAKRKRCYVDGNLIIAFAQDWADKAASESNRNLRAYSYERDPLLGEYIWLGGRKVPRDVPESFLVACSYSTLPPYLCNEGHWGKNL